MNMTTSAMLVWVLWYCRDMWYTVVLTLGHIQDWILVSNLFSARRLPCIPNGKVGRGLGLRLMIMHMGSSLN